MLRDGWHLPTSYARRGDERRFLRDGPQGRNYSSFSGVRSAADTHSLDSPSPGRSLGRDTAHSSVEPLTPETESPEYPELQSVIAQAEAPPEPAKNSIIGWITYKCNRSKGLKVGTTNLSLVPSLFAGVSTRVINHVNVGIRGVNLLESIGKGPTYSRRRMTMGHRCRPCELLEEGERRDRVSGREMSRDDSPTRPDSD